MKRTPAEVAERWAAGLAKIAAEGCKCQYCGKVEPFSAWLDSGGGTVFHCPHCLRPLVGP